jgi:D-3-phosphoglycerate dehydrogenase / 2-oxoglutarate reductase
MSQLIEPVQYSFPKQKMKILLLEGIHPIASQKFQDSGYIVESIKKALTPHELKEIISKVHILGIRSKTELKEDILNEAQNLIGIGCFCIGTNQVDLRQAALSGIPVFNAPFGNTRSVAELTIGNIIMLARKAFSKSSKMHQGIWDKSAEGCCEIRNKVLGIIGYGNIGQQVGILAESLGMKVIFYDIGSKLPLGNAKKVYSLQELLSNAHFVTLHVPETPLTKNMMSDDQFELMQKGSCLLNLSRGTVVSIQSLAKYIQSNHLAGAAIDVFPVEPNSNKDPFVSELRGLENVILTPHVGAGTEEAQYNIGIEVSEYLIRLTETGSTSGSVNFPQVELPLVKNYHRVLNIHKNVPGVLKDINNIIAAMGVNIYTQFLSTKDDVGYLIMDVEKSLSKAVKDKIDALETSIKTRLLF